MPQKEIAQSNEVEEMEHLANGEHEIIEPDSKERRQTPAASKHTYVDFDEIDRDLGFSEPGSGAESDDTGREDSFRMAAEMLLPVGEFLTRPDDAKTRGALTTAFFYCLKPELFDNATATEVGAAIGFEKAAFHKHLVSVRDRFGLKTLYCKNDEGREKYRKLATGNKNYSGSGLIHRQHKKWERKQALAAAEHTTTE